MRRPASAWSAPATASAATTAAGAMSSSSNAGAPSPVCDPSLQPRPGPAGLPPEVRWPAHARAAHRPPRLGWARPWARAASASEVESERGEVAGDPGGIGVLHVAEHDDLDVVVGQVHVHRRVAHEETRVIPEPVSLQP